MFYIATYDIGTTAVKGVLVRNDGVIEDTESLLLKTYFYGENKEQNPEEWYEAFCEIGKRFAKRVDANNITAIIMSGQMQDLILVDENGNALRNAILYSDVRAAKEADEIVEKISKDEITKITSNNFDGSIPLAKLMWIKKNEPEQYDHVYKILISSKDYIVNRLTGIAIGDYTACSTAGAMNLANKTWDLKMIGSLELKGDVFPELKYPHEMVGKVKDGLQNECGFNNNTIVYAGIGDAGATTLASGVSEYGEFNINIGTSGWVATISNKLMNLEGRVFNLAGFTEQSYINVVPFFNAGNVHKWITKIFSETDELDYKKIGTLLSESKETSNGLLFLPYLNGERFPVIDSKIKGCYYGITPDTSKEDLVRASLEGVAFSIRQGMELIGNTQKSISIIGGGAREKVWCQLIADILGKNIVVYKNSDILPAKAIASSVLLAQGRIKNYNEFISSLQNEDDCVTFQADEEKHRIYNESYKRYLKLYPCLKNLV